MTDGGTGVAKFGSCASGEEACDSMPLHCGVKEEACSDVVAATAQLSVGYQPFLLLLLFNNFFIT